MVLQNIILAVEWLGHVNMAVRICKGGRTGGGMTAPAGPLPSPLPMPAPGPIISVVDLDDSDTGITLVSAATTPRALFPEKWLWVDKISGYNLLKT